MHMYAPTCLARLFDETGGRRWRGVAPLTALMCVPCADSAAITDETAVFVPKQRVMVRMNPAMNSLSSRQRVLNGLRSTVTSDLMRIEDTPATEVAEFVVKASYMEIYMEKVNDLLDPKKQNLQVHEVKGRGFLVKDLTLECVTCAEDLFDLMDIGAEHRHQAATAIQEVLSPCGISQAGAVGILHSVGRRHCTKAHLELCIAAACRRLAQRLRQVDGQALQIGINLQIAVLRAQIDPQPIRNNTVGRYRLGERQPLG